MHAKKLLNKSATHGTPCLFVLPKNFGAFPFLDMNKSDLEATYKLEFPAEMTDMTIKPLIREAAGSIPALSKAIVKGDLAVREPAARRFGSLYGIKIPIKNIIPT